MKTLKHIRWTEFCSDNTKLSVSAAEESRLPHDPAMRAKLAQQLRRELEKSLKDGGWHIGPMKTT